MFDNIRKRIGMSYTRFHFRRKREAPMQFTDILSRSRRALVIFPETVLDSESSQTLPRYFLRKFAPGSVLFVIRQDLLSSIAAGPTAKIATYSESDVNTWFIPRDTLLRKVKTSTFDVVVDLNLELALPSAFVCRETDAPQALRDTNTFTLHCKGWPQSSGTGMGKIASTRTKHEQTTFSAQLSIRQV